MRILPSRIHGVLDYTLGLLLIISPWMLGFQTGGADEKLPVVMGIALLAYSLCTRYELGLFKVMDFRRHLAFDAVGGAALAISPWLFGFADRVWVPHVVFGLLEVGAAAATTPYTTLPDPNRSLR